jgi:hypothetical protein
MTTTNNKEILSQVIRNNVNAEESPFEDDYKSLEEATTAFKDWLKLNQSDANVQSKKEVGNE